MPDNTHTVAADDSGLQHSLRALRAQLDIYDREQVPVEVFNEVESAVGRLVKAAQRVLEESPVDEHSSDAMQGLLAAVLAAPDPVERVGDDL